MSDALLHVKGIVQGVGFRPFVHRLAVENGFSGWVQNTADGVKVAIAPGSRAESFRNMILANPPALARILSITIAPWEESLPASFEIRRSDTGQVSTGVAPDAAICAQCAAEMDDPADRRFNYPFLNCTQCGPRFSITSTIPYDRANTAMAPFELCDACSNEFDDIADRRFHAQPTACPDCGPHIWFEDGNAPVEGDAIESAADLLRNGGVLALRGIGGFHLACLACDEVAVTALRHRKHRPTKPFATMVRDLTVADRYARLSKAAIEQLRSQVAPIVLAPAIEPSNLATSVTAGLATLGLMLPYSPLHHLIMYPFDEPLVMTSGNRGGAPQVTSNAEARQQLDGIADGFLFHNREIINRVDDSVVQIVPSGPQVLRRARGFAPAMLQLPSGFDGHPEAIAFGVDLKNAFALAKDGNAIVSQHIGDLNDLKTTQDLLSNIKLLTRLFDCKPQLVVCDKHSDYRSTKMAQAFAVERGLPLIEVQHHHAHAAAAMAEHGLARNAEIIAIVQDGLGMGEDGALWGAEVLSTSYRDAARLATLKPAALPGGDAAALEPWRNLVARLNDAYPTITEWPQSYRKLLKDHPVKPLLEAINNGINSPVASSAGRLFDAVAVALNLAPVRQTYEAEAAMQLEKQAGKWVEQEGPVEPYALNVSKQTVAETQLIVVDPAPIWENLQADEQSGGVDYAAARFHSSWANAWTNIAKNMNPKRQFVLSGGTFQNQMLANQVVNELAQSGRAVLQHHDFPANDGGIALGQLVVALANHSWPIGE